MPPTLLTSHEQVGWRAFRVLLCALLVPIVPFVLLGELPGERWLSAQDKSSLSFAAMGSLLLALDVLLPIPSSILGALLGARLGAVLGFLATWVGLCSGHVVGYLLGRLVPRRFVPELPEAPSLALLFISRPVPVLAEAAVIAAGAARVSPRGFGLSIAAGNAIYASLLSASGALLLPQGWLGPGLIVPFALPVLSWLVWRRLRSRPARG